MITEYLMKPGQWELSLVPNAPLAVREAIINNALYRLEAHRKINDS